MFLTHTNPPMSGQVIVRVFDVQFLFEAGVVEFVPAVRSFCGLSKLSVAPRSE